MTNGAARISRFQSIFFGRTKANTCVLPAGAADSGADFEKAVQAISDSGNQDDLDTLEAAGIDVDAALDGNGGDANGGNDNANAQNGQNAQQGQNAQNAQQGQNGNNKNGN